METSQTIGELAAALAKFQGEVDNVKKDGKNPFFKSKYATLENVIATIRGPLKDNDLSFSQFPTGENELATILMHKSGEYIKATAKMNPKDNSPQSQGSAITYLRRYALSAILGIATEDDDDGNAASSTPKPRRMDPYQIVRRAIPTPEHDAQDVTTTTTEPEQFLEQDEIYAVLKDQIKQLVTDLGHKKQTKQLIQELTGLEPIEKNYKMIKLILEKRLSDTDPLAVFDNEE